MSVELACRLNAQSSDGELKYDVILLSVGSRYKMYCSNISRTYMVDPTKTQEAEYKALLDAQSAAIIALKPGKPMSDAYNAVVSVLQVLLHFPHLLARIKLASFVSSLPCFQSCWSCKATTELLLFASFILISRDCLYQTPLRASIARLSSLMMKHKDKEDAVEDSGSCVLCYCRESFLSLLPFH